MDGKRASEILAEMGITAGVDNDSKKIVFFKEVDGLIYKLFIKVGDELKTELKYKGLEDLEEQIIASAGYTFGYEEDKPCGFV